MGERGEEGKGVVSSRARRDEGGVALCQRGGPTVSFSV